MSYKDNKFQRRRQWERRKHRGNAKPKKENSLGAARLKITPKPIPTNTSGCDTSTPAADEMGVAKGVDMFGVHVAGVMFLLMFAGLLFGAAWAIFS